MADDSLIPAIPDDIAGARIGSCYNQFTRKIMEGEWAILPSSAGEDDVVFIKGVGEVGTKRQQFVRGSRERLCFQSGYQRNAADMKALLPASTHL